MRPLLMLLGLTLSASVHAKMPTESARSPRLAALCAANLELEGVGQTVNAANVDSIMGFAHARLDDLFFRFKVGRPGRTVQAARTFLRYINPFATPNVHVVDARTPDAAVGKFEARRQVDALVDLRQRLVDIRKIIRPNPTADDLDGQIAAAKAEAEGAVKVRVIEGRQKILSYLESLRVKTLATEARVQFAQAEARATSAAPAVETVTPAPAPELVSNEETVVADATWKDKLIALRANRTARMVAYGLSALTVTAVADHFNPALGLTSTLLSFGGYYMFFKDAVKDGFEELSALFTPVRERVKRGRADLAERFVARSDVEMAHLDQMIAGLKGFERSNAFSYLSTQFELPLSPEVDLKQPGAATALQRNLIEREKVAAPDRTWTRIEYILFNDGQGQKLYRVRSKLSNPSRDAMNSDVYCTLLPF